MKKFICFILVTLLTQIALAEVQFVRVMFYGNASNRAVIGWDQVSGENPILHFDTVRPFDFEFSQSQSITTKNNAKGMFNHFVHLENLLPNQAYYFSIKDDKGFSKVYYFYTAPNVNSEQLSFIGGGDSRTRSSVRRLANQMVEKLKPHAVLFAGDYTGFDTQKEWLQWFTDWELTTGTDGRIIPIVPTRGNHEKTNKVMVDIFDVPCKRAYYSTQFGGSLFNVVVLNSEIWKGGAQTWFLNSELKEHADFNWQMPMYHRPMRPHVSHKNEMQTQYRNFVPVFEKYKNVRLALECDSHTCKSTWPILKSKDKLADEGFVRDDKKGIVYIGEGCWGAPPRAADDLKSWTRDAEMNDSFKWIFVSKEKIDVRTVLYSNVNEVQALSNKTRFSLPDNILIWNPSNGSVVNVLPIEN